MIRNCSVWALWVTESANSEFWKSGEESRTFNNGAAIEAIGGKALAAEDQAILEAYVAEVRSRQASSGGMTHGADKGTEPNIDG